MTSDPIVDPLNEPQKEAVLETDGPLLILAGAGSGKTRALTHRIAHLMRNGVEPWEILAVTFTNKAATEMQDRIRNLLGVTEGQNPEANQVPNAQNPKLPVMGTFHSVCARILRKDIDKLGRDRSFVIYDASDQERLMKQILKEMNIDSKELKSKAVLGYIGRFKSEAVLPKEAESDATTARMQYVISAYKRYQTALREANALDFDDLILETVRLFHEVPEVLERYQRTWKYLHIDEYQDTNHAQYLFITLLAQTHGNLCVIGDPDQSIYSFRGADIRNILEFEKDYPSAKKIKLEQNYRSTQPILTASDAVISKNPNRPEKQMWTEQKQGPKIVVQEVDSEKKEASEAIRIIENLKSESTPLKDQVILYRTNAQSRLFEEACMRAGIPYKIIGGVKFYARREVKDVLAYLYVILNPYDTLSLMRIINVPSRKIGETTMAKVQALAVGEGIPLWEGLRRIEEVESLNDGTKVRIIRFVEIIEKLQQMSEREVVSALALDLIEATSMQEWLRDDTEEGETRWENVQELLSVMHKYDTLEPKLSLTSFLEEVALVSEVDSLDTDEGNSLTLMTLHLCKGLEFEHVIIAGCEEGIFPHSNSSFDREQLEEERRIMYVGMTRAKKHLTLMNARSRMLWGETQSNAPSRFLEDLPHSVTEFRSDDVLNVFAKISEQALQGESTFGQMNQSTGVDLEFNQDFEYSDTETVSTDDFEESARIEHPVFGKGTVMSKRGDVVEIRFDSGERKSFALSVAPLKLI